MYYIVQENTFREENYEKLIHNLSRLELPFEIVKVLPFIETFEFNTDRKDVFVFGSLKLARISKELGWEPGSLMNSNHDFDVYKEYYQNNLLNYDSKIHKFSDSFEWQEPYLFIRPCEDTKTFNGQVFSKNDWEEFVQHHLNNGHTTLLNKNTRIQVSLCKNIQKEIRFWVVGGKIITGSQYRLGDRTVYNEVYEKEAEDFAQRMVDKFSLASSFVIDVCLVNNEWKIVECGCINCAGFYHSNMSKLIQALEEHYYFSSMF